MQTHIHTPHFRTHMAIPYQRADTLYHDMCVCVHANSELSQCCMCAQFVGIKVV